MRRVSFCVSKRMHPTEWENLTIDRQTDTEGAKKRKGFSGDEWPRIWKE